MSAFRQWFQIQAATKNVRTTRTTYAGSQRAVAQAEITTTEMPDLIFEALMRVLDIQRFIDGALGRISHG
jgi:hypothetical protein